MEPDNGSRTERTSSTVGDPERSPGLNALVGAVVTVVLAFLPFSPALGGGVAGYLQQGGEREGLRIGALAGLIAAVPLLAVFGVIVLVLVFGVAVSGEVGGPVFVIGVLLIIAVFVLGYTVALSAVGGLVGAAIADRETADDDTD